MTPIERAIESAGGQTALGRVFVPQITGKAVAKWITEGVPAERVLKVEAATGVSRHELRPDLYPRDDCSCPNCQQQVDG